eukprot:NODE_6385_length_456_cov_16.798526_g4857_i0.p1 GENE.NODE_6385_length_456_cov_16.798526_g4857_i0~~NODE_6385_length_456_cov_16.798526_g4857_i0.p1  ORF type:complete len:84 (+),score=22.31 NODE_6385_length_456_cov_16.798526_g4857_i0:63-314(+)
MCIRDRSFFFFFFWWFGPRGAHRGRWATIDISAFQLSPLGGGGDRREAPNFFSFSFRKWPLEASFGGLRAKSGENPGQKRVQT